MKREFILSIAAFVASVSAYAQMMPDSTVQIVPYWSKGDKMSYDCATTNYNLNENGNLSDVKTLSDTKIFEVLDEREDGYTLRLSYKNVVGPNSMDFLTPKDFRELKEKFSIIFTTDRNGSVTGLANQDDCKAVMSGAIDKIIDRGVKAMDKEKRESFPREKLSFLLKNIFFSDEALSRVVELDITPFFACHGLRLDTTQVYTFPQYLPVPMMENETLEVETRLWVDKELTGGESAVIRTHALATKEMILQTMQECTVKLMKSVAEMSNKELSEEEIAGISDEIAKQIQDMKMEVSSSTMIHLSSGWPVQLYNTREIVALGEDKSVRKVTERSAQLSKVQGRKVRGR